MIIELDLRDMLPTIREAFDNKTLQMFNQTEEGTGRCFYSGPCAIGVCMTKEQQEYCDAQPWSSIRSLIDNNKVVIPGEQERFFYDLQMTHDRAAAWTSIEDEGLHAECIAQFDTLLTKLEQKYA